MLADFYDGYTINEVPYQKLDYYGTMIYLNENKREKLLKDISRFSFNSLYPHIIIKLYKEGNLKVSIPEFMELYEFIVINHILIISHKDCSDTSRYLLRFMINYLYGLANNPYNISDLKIFGIEKVSSYTDDIFKELIANEPNVIYIDCDSVYYENKSGNIVEESLKKLDIPWEIRYDINGYFIQKKKYIYEENGEVKLKGINLKTKKTRKPEHIIKIEEVIEKLKLITRLNKVNRLKSIIDENR